MDSAQSVPQPIFMPITTASKADSHPDFIINVLQLDSIQTQYLINTIQRKNSIIPHALVKSTIRQIKIVKIINFFKFYNKNTQKNNHE